MISESEYELPAIKTKYCGRCKRDLPATLEYFFPSYLIGSSAGRSECKKCHALRTSKKPPQGDHVTLVGMAQEIEPSVVMYYQSMQSILKRARVSISEIKSDIFEKHIPIYKYTSGTRVLLMLRIEDAEAYILSKQAGEGLQIDKPPSQNIPIPLLVSSTGTPDQCGACGAENVQNILGDINKQTSRRYGYLCPRCKKLVDSFHADQSKMSKVLDYLRRTRQ